MAMSRIRILEPMQHPLLILPVLLLVLIVSEAAAGSLVSPNNRQPSQRFFYAAATSSSSTQTKVRLLRQADDPSAAPGALEGSCCQGAAAEAGTPLTVRQMLQSHHTSISMVKLIWKLFDNIILLRDIFSKIPIPVLSERFEWYNKWGFWKFQG